MVSENKENNTSILVEKKYEEIARDLHDGISQQLVTILWKMGELKNFNQKEKIIEQVTMLEDQMRQVINDLQRIVYGIRPVFLDQLGLQEGIKVWTQKQLELQNIQFKIKKYPYPLNLSRFVEGQVFRILQEGINNIIRHAEAKNVTLTIEREGNCLVIILMDDGKGFLNDNEETGLGLSLIKERAALIQSEVQIISQPEGGTTLKISIPYRGDEVV